jgi:hypothetical protein
LSGSEFGHLKVFLNCNNYSPFRAQKQGVAWTVNRTSEVGETVPSGAAVKLVIGRLLCDRYSSSWLTFGIGSFVTP